MIYDNARILTDSQTDHAQVRQVKVPGARNLLREVASGVKIDRGVLHRTLEQLVAGDVLNALAPLAS